MTNQKIIRTRREFIKDSLLSTAAFLTPYWTGVLGNTSKTNLVYISDKLADIPANIRNTLAWKCLEDERTVGLPVNDGHFEELYELLSRYKEIIYEPKMDYSFDEETYNSLLEIKLWLEINRIDSILKSRFEYHEQEEINKALYDSKSDCDIDSLMCCSFGELIRTKIAEVVAPRHSFIKAFTETGAASNFESRNAKEISDKRYKFALNIPEGSIRKGQYLKPLTKDESRANHLLQIALILPQKYKDNKNALKAIDLALELDNSKAIFYATRGLILYSNGYRNGIDKVSEKSMDIDPYDPVNYIACGLVHYQLGNIQKAHNLFNKSIEVQPIALGYENRALTYKELGKNIKSRKDCKTAIYYEKQEKLKREIIFGTPQP